MARLNIGAMAMVCVLLLGVLVSAEVKDDKQHELQRLEQAATADSEEAAIAALRNLLVEEDRLLKFLNAAGADRDASTEWAGPSMQKRSCIRKGASCDSRPNDCCELSACRCNLWGTNCRCHRAGLLQRLGK